ncbi:hypothetical protein BOSEA31B_10600 [Hyphomicrobiales bacterium]|nr:hypothetical protein BOSEA31B_10600 [Hyphomicrobiales bacterium]CAH1700455.1 hypothetical protein BOSEA1005_20154 [Hyphomicrobiales bacterium]
MPSTILDAIDAELEACGWSDIAEFGNKFVAHAADEFSRSTLLDGQNGLTLDGLQKCHRAICQSVATLFGPVLWEGSHGLFPIPQFNHFENLDAAWLRSGDVEELHSFWDKHVAEVDDWSNDPLKAE